MVTLDFHKPSTWSKQQKIGALGLILLVIGPFLPYVVTEFNFENQTVTNSFSYFNFAFWGFFMFIPHLCALIIAFLFYLKAEIYMQKNSNMVNMKPLMIMSLSFWFFLTYLIDALRFIRLSGYSLMYPGIGFIFIVAGFFLCTLAGFYEWRSSKKVDQGVPMAPTPLKKGETTVQAVPKPQSAVAVQKAPQEKMPTAPLNVKPINVVAQRPESTVTPVNTAPEQVEVPSREMTSEEQKHLLRWVNHIGKDGQTFEQCLNCQNYVFLKATKTPEAVTFKCPDCGEVFLYKK